MLHRQQQLTFLQDLQLHDGASNQVTGKLVAQGSTRIMYPAIAAQQRGSWSERTACQQLSKSRPAIVLAVAAALYCTCGMQGRVLKQQQQWQALAYSQQCKRAGALLVSVCISLSLSPYFSFSSASLSLSPLSLPLSCNPSLSPALCASLLVSLSTHQRSPPLSRLSCWTCLTACTNSFYTCPPLSPAAAAALPPSCPPPSLRLRRRPRGRRRLTSTSLTPTASRLAQGSWRAWASTCASSSARRSVMTRCGSSPSSSSQVGGVEGQLAVVGGRIDSVTARSQPVVVALVCPCVVLQLLLQSQFPCVTDWGQKKLFNVLLSQEQ